MLTLDADLEVARVLKQLVLEELLVECREPHDGEGSEEDVVELVEPRVVERLPAEGRIEPVPELRQHEHDVLVEDVTDKECIASVGLPTVSEQQVLQEFELTDCVVCGTGGLLSLEATDPDADVRRRDHVDVVGAIADRERSGSWVPLLDEGNDLSLLFRRDTTSEHYLDAIAQFHELTTEVLREVALTL